MEPTPIHVEKNEWELRHDESSGQAYYVNVLTGESSWEAPELLRALPVVVTTHRQWTEATDESGRVYYVNLETMETSWDPPEGFINESALTVASSSEALRRPSTAEQMDELNALLSGGDDGGEGEGDGEVLDGEEVAQSHDHEQKTGDDATTADGSEWMMFLNETDGVPYYYNHITGDCVWEAPGSFLEYHLQHNGDSSDSGVEAADDGHATDGATAITSRSVAHTPMAPQAPPPRTARTPPPIVITPEFEEKVRRAVESASKTPVGSSRLLFVRTPTVKALDDTASTARSGSRPSSSSGSTRRPTSAARSARAPPVSRPTSSSSGARSHRMATVDDDMTPVAPDEEQDAEQGIIGIVEVPGVDASTLDTTESPLDTIALAALIEQEAREWQQREELQRELLFDEAAILIQCLIRCFLARHRVARKRLDRGQPTAATTTHALVEDDPPESAPSVPHEEKVNQDSAETNTPEIEQEQVDKVDILSTLPPADPPMSPLTILHDDAIQERPLVDPCPLESTKQDVAQDIEATEVNTPTETTPAVTPEAEVGFPPPTTIIPLEEPPVVAPVVSIETVAALDAPAPVPRGSTRQSARSGSPARSSRHSEVRAAAAVSPPRSPVREPRKASIGHEPLTGRLAVLNASTYFPVRSTRVNRSCSSTVLPDTKVHHTNQDNAIVRKPIVNISHPPVTQQNTTKPKEQHPHEDRVARQEAMEKARVEAKEKWATEVTQYRAIFAESATRAAKEVERIRLAEQNRYQAATDAKKQRLKQEKESVACSPIDENQTMESGGDLLWGSIRDGSCGNTENTIVTVKNQLNAAARDPTRFVETMMRERLRSIKSTIKRLAKAATNSTGSAEAITYWQNRVGSFPSKGFSRIDDRYWQRLHDKLTKISFSSGSNLASQITGYRTPEYDSLLHAAAWNGHMEIVKFLAMEMQADVNAVDSTVTKTTPLHEACRGGHAEVVAYLLAHGAWLDSVDHHGETGLHIASRLGWTQVVHKLISAGQAAQEPQQQQDTTGKTPTRVLRSLSWPECFNLRNWKQRRAIDLATLPSLIDILTHVMSPEISTDFGHDVDDKAMHPPPHHGRGTSASVTRRAKAAAKKKTTRPHSAAKINLTT